MSNLPSGLLHSKEDNVFVQALYIQHYPLMRHTARRYLRNAEDVDDAIIETCLALMGKLDTFRRLDDDAIPRYIHAIARNVALMLLRKRNAESRAYERMIANARVQQEADTETRAICRCMLADVQQALPLLPPKDQEVLWLRAFERLSDAEIGKIMRIRNSSVRTRLTRARRRLYQVMEALGNTPPGNQRHPGRCAD